MSIKLLVVLCLGVLVAQGNAYRPPALRDNFDYLIKILGELESHVTDAVRDGVDALKVALKEVEDASTDILNAIGTELQAATAAMLAKISDLEDRARELGIDISDCVGDNPNIINDITEELLGLTAQCLDDLYLDGEGTVNIAINEINNETSKIDSYWARIDVCQRQDYDQQEICVHELESEINRDAVEIPDEISLFIEEAVGYIDILKTDLLSCTSGKIAYLAELGDAIIANVTGCAENKFDQITTVTPTEAPTTQPPTTQPPTTQPPTTQPPTTQPPTTQPPTTQPPTTQPPTTQPPTTQPPTTEPPTTQPPTTQPPTTQPPTTQPPTTQPPTTQPPTTEPPTTQPPTTQPPTTEPPTTQPPTTQPPTTQPPTTQPPTTEPPTTQPPTTQPPTTQPPTTQPPTTQPPTTQPPTTQPDTIQPETTTAAPTTVELDPPTTGAPITFIPPNY